ncbi:hypothetical protein KC19_5G057000 [Ceratodon purpureus]|uniref:Uncharacterized protein n=1 Tax=Ceratodon purpureus TaxID=3225 RepID=A0A8T0HZB1_CERPU|nr:hypothetical protein KC19_5G057000 [Ceratodon purpureus]
MLQGLVEAILSNGSFRKNPSLAGDSLKDQIEFATTKVP